MTYSVTQAAPLGKAIAVRLVLGALCGATLSLPQAAIAQVAGGSQAGGGGPVVNSALSSDSPPPIDRPQCFHRSTDNHPSTKSDDKLLTVWLSVRQQAVATIGVSGYATGDRLGTLRIVVTSDGTPFAYSPEVQGTSVIAAHTGANLPLLPGRQYKITAKPIVSNKVLGVFKMDVGLNKTCP